MSASDTARAVIGQVHASLPATATFKERKAALHAAYPFGERAMWPYKAWCKAQADYLRKYAPPESKRFPLSPLERLMLKAGK